MPLPDRLAALSKHVPSGGLTAASVVTHDWLYLGLAAAIEVLLNPAGTALNGIADNFKRVRSAIPMARSSDCGFRTRTRPSGFANCRSVLNQFSA